MKCQSCDIHEADYIISIPKIESLGEPLGDIIMMVQKKVCSECAYELAEKIQDMF